MAVAALVALAVVWSWAGDARADETSNVQDSTSNVSTGSGQAVQQPSGSEAAGELNPIRRGEPGGRGTGSGPEPGWGNSDGGLGAGQIVLALGIVLSLILVLRWVVARLMSGGAGVGSAGAVQVLSRTVVSPRQHLMLVRVGRRLVVVANSGAQMNAVCEIRDAEEVAELIGRVEEEKGGSLSGTFSALFSREKQEYDSAPPTGPAGAEADDPGISETREELSGLMEKVRVVSRQFGRVR